MTEPARSAGRDVVRELVVALRGEPAVLPEVHIRFGKVTAVDAGAERVTVELGSVQVSLRALAPPPAVGAMVAVAQQGTDRFVLGSFDW